MLAMGSGPYSAQLAGGLSQCGHKIILAVAHPEGSEIRDNCREFIRRSGFRYIAMADRPWRSIRGAASMLYTLLRMIRFKPQIFHITSAGPRIETLLFVRVAQVMGIPIVLTIHDAQFHPGDYCALRHLKAYSRVIDRSDRIIVHGHSIRNLLSSKWMVSPDRIKVLGHGNRDLYIDNLPLVSKTAALRPFILFFGRMRAYKGLDILLQAAPLIAKLQPEARIVIAGRGPELDRLRNNCDSHQNVDVWDHYISFRDLADLFHHCAMLVIPYIEASQSGPVAIAFSFGKPVIASDVGALPETINHGREGLLIPPGNPEKLAEAVVDLLRDRRKAEEMGKRAKQKASDELSWGERIAPDTLAVYEVARQRLGGSSKDRKSAGIRRVEMLRRYHRELRSNT